MTKFPVESDRNNYYEHTKNLTNISLVRIFLRKIGWITLDKPIPEKTINTNFYDFIYDAIINQNCDNILGFEIEGTTITHGKSILTFSFIETLYDEDEDEDENPQFSISE